MPNPALKCDREPARDADAERLTVLRSLLPLQTEVRNLDEARLRYQTVRYDHAAKELRRTLPWKLFSRRRIHAWTITAYPRFIPDAVLLRWDDASRSGLFRTFWVLEPRYGKQVETRPSDPWLIGKISGTYTFTFGKEDQVAVIAYWE